MEVARLGGQGLGDKKEERKELAHNVVDEGAKLHSSFVNRFLMYLARQFGKKFGAVPPIFAGMNKLLLPL